MLTANDYADPAILRLARTTLGLTQKQLAERLGVGKSIISDWEQGHCVPRPRRRAALARVLKLPPPPAPAAPDRTTQEAARAPSLSPTDAVSALAPLTSAAQAGGGDTSPRSTPGPVPRVGRLTEHAARGWRPPHAEIEIVCHLCGYRPGQHPAGHRAWWVEAA